MISTGEFQKLGQKMVALKVEGQGAVNLIPRLDDVQRLLAPSDWPF